MSAGMQPWRALGIKPGDPRAVLAAEWRAAGLQTERTLAQEVAAGAARKPDARLTFWSADRAPVSVTLAQAWEESAGVAAGLAAQGLGAGDVLVVQVPAWYENLLLLLASLRLSLVYVPVVHIYGPAELGFILRQSRTRALVVPDLWRKIDYVRRIAEIGDVPELRRIIVIGSPAALPGAVGWDAMLRDATPVADFSAAPDDVCVMLYTSGTTAEPKGVLHTHQSLAADVRSSGLFIDRAAPAPMLSCSVAGHIGGILTNLRPFLLGMDTIYLDFWNAAAAAELVQRHRIGWANGAPYHLNSLIDAGAGGKLASFTHFLTGGASVPAELVERAQRAGIAACRSYGGSEHPTVTSGHPDETLALRANTDGRALPGWQIRIEDDAGMVLPQGRAGEIVCVGPELFLGYLDQGLNAQAFTPDGWFRTGDIGVLDDDGYLTIVDRKKDIIIRGGENISSKEVEDIMLRHPAVADAAAVGWPDRLLGERVAVFVQLREGLQLTLADVQAHFAAAGVARQKTPEHVVAVPGLPRNPAGKVLKTNLRRQARTLADATSKEDAP